MNGVQKRKWAKLFTADTGKLTLHFVECVSCSLRLLGTSMARIFEQYFGHITAVRNSSKKNTGNRCESNQCVKFTLPKTMYLRKLRWCPGYHGYLCSLNEKGETIVQTFSILPVCEKRFIQVEAGNYTFVLTPTDSDELWFYRQISCSFKAQTLPFLPAFPGPQPLLLLLTTEQYFFSLKDFSIFISKINTRSVWKFHSRKCQWAEFHKENNKGESRYVTKLIAIFFTFYSSQIPFLMTVNVIWRNFF